MVFDPFSIKILISQGDLFMQQPMYPPQGMPTPMPMTATGVTGVKLDLSLIDIIVFVFVWILLISVTFGIGYFFFIYSAMVFVTNKLYLVGPNGAPTGKLECNLGCGDRVINVIIWMVLSVITLGFASFVYPFYVYKLVLANSRVVSVTPQNMPKY
jgi:hypothetical protein